jgi:hypothetical protein
MKASCVSTTLVAIGGQRLMKPVLAIGLLLLASTLALLACGGSSGEEGEPTIAANTTPGSSSGGAFSQGNEPNSLDPAQFVAKIDDPYWPMKPGSTWVFSETDEEGNELRVEVTVTSDVKTSLVSARL